MWNENENHSQEYIHNESPSEMECMFCECRSEMGR